MSEARKAKKPRDKSGGGYRWPLSGFYRWRDGRFPKAFPEDTYLADLNRAANTRKPWVRVIPVVIFLSLVADYSLLSDTFDMAFQSNLWITYAVPLALVASYLALGYLAGKKINEYKAFRQGSALVSAILLGSIELITLVFIFVIRCYGELQKEGGIGGGGLNLSFGNQSGTLQIGKASSTSDFSAFVDAVFDKGVDVLFPAIALSLIMLIGAGLGMYYAYCTCDSYAAKKKLISESCIAEDRQLYESTFFKVVSSTEKNLEYEKRERELDQRALGASFRVNSLIAKLNSIVDPADAYDFTSGTYDFASVGRALDKTMTASGK